MTVLGINIVDFMHVVLSRNGILQTNHSSMITAYSINLVGMAMVPSQHRMRS